MSLKVKLNTNKSEIPKGLERSFLQGVVRLWHDDRWTTSPYLLAVAQVEGTRALADKDVDTGTDSQQQEDTLTARGGKIANQRLD